MKTQIMLFVLAALMLAACAPASNDADVLTAAPTAARAPTLPPAVAPTPTENAAPPEPGVTPLAETCADADAAQLGQVIANGFAFTSVGEVLEWFCNGAAFEDIVIALETEDLTGAPAEDLLSMLAGGMTWEEIWQSIGLTE